MNWQVDQDLHITLDRRAGLRYAISRCLYLFYSARQTNRTHLHKTPLGLLLNDNPFFTQQQIREGVQDYWYLDKIL